MNLLSLLFPRLCYRCQQELMQSEQLLCLSCYMQLQRTHFENKPQANPLYHLLGGRLPLSWAISLYYFDKRGCFQHLIQALKYKKARKVGSLMGKEFGKILQDTNLLTGTETVIPVPLHPKKHKKRGYNQAELIAKGICKGANLPLDTKALVRKRFTETQTRKSSRERWKNVEGAFEVRRELPSRVLLIDDVITTGSTIEACGKQLLEAKSDIQIAVASLGVVRV